MEYNTFSVGPELDGYRLHVSGYHGYRWRGTKPGHIYDINSFRSHPYAAVKYYMANDKMKFSTFDKRNDVCFKINR